ncbi:MAG TPA: T9SS type A sorting domain-containing protein, partial [Chloroflexota bacterium]
DGISMIPDGSGGAMLAWEDERGSSYDIYAQRIDSSGKSLWTAGGIPVCNVQGNQNAPAVVPDGKGGAVIVWDDGRPSGRRSDIYAQRLSAAGQNQWAVGGVPVLGAVVANFVPPSIVANQGSGTFVSWTDGRDLSNALNIYAQYIDSAGVTRWDTNGVGICTFMANQQEPVIASDRAGGAIITWTDARTAPNTGVYAQRVNGSGAAQWTKDGIVVNDTTNDQKTPAIVTDKTGSAIITWLDKRSTGTFDIYAQRMDLSGKRRWSSAGVPLVTNLGDMSGVVLVSDSLGGAIAAWTDSRNPDLNIYAQRIDSSGKVLWLVNGLPISTAPRSQQGPAIAMTQHGMAVIAWTDGRGTDDDIYAQNVDLTGARGAAPALLSPLNGAAVAADSARLVWSRGVPTATKYRLDLSIDSLFVFGSSDSTLTDTAKTVRGLLKGNTYWWRVRAFDGSWGPFSLARKFLTSTTSVELPPGTPTSFSLGQNYPNPFNPATMIRYGLPHASHVTLVVYDALGRRVAELVNGTIEAGYHEVKFDGRNLASGVYFYKLEAADFVQVRKLMIIR